MAKIHLHRGQRRPLLAIIGGESLLGREVRDLAESADLGVEVQLVASGQEGDTNIIAAGAEEPLVMSTLAAADLQSAKAVMLAGSVDSSRTAMSGIKDLNPPPAVIDLSGALEDTPGARLRAPMVDSAGPAEAVGTQVIAHPAAIALAVFLTHLSKAGAIRRSMAEIFEPVSERGQAGIDELQKQTVALLSFKQLPKEVFDTQVSFSMLPEYGSDSPHSLAAVEQKIERHLASLLAGSTNLPMPSLRLIHAPVFHGYSISAWVEFEEIPSIDAVFDSLVSNQIDVRKGSQEPPSNVGIAGQGGIAVGGIRPDRNQSRAVWFWIAADNLRIVAENAVEVARELIA